MAEVATGVLHNVGNVLNSVNISVSLLSDQVRRSKLVELDNFVARLAEQGEKLPEFLSAEGRSTKLVAFLQCALQRLKSEHEETAQETESLGQKVEHIKGIIHAQQVHAKQVPFRERVNLGQLIDDVITLHSDSIHNHGIDVRVEADEVPTITVEKAKLLQVIDNLLKNAIESIVHSEAEIRWVNFQIQMLEPDAVRLTISDTGGGIAPEDLNRIFSYGFTTKAAGNGFGLHASALAMASVGGRICVHSPGVGQGAVFTVELPLESTSGKKAADAEAAKSVPDGPRSAAGLAAPAESSTHSALEPAVAVPMGMR
jgi:signal transduction histidine kinase